MSNSSSSSVSNIISLGNTKTPATQHASSFAALSMGLDGSLTASEVYDPTIFNERIKPWFALIQGKKETSAPFHFPANNGRCMGKHPWRQLFFVPNVNDAGETVYALAQVHSVIDTPFVGECSTRQHIEVAVNHIRVLSQKEGMGSRSCSINVQDQQGNWFSKLEGNRILANIYRQHPWVESFLDLRQITQPVESKIAVTIADPTSYRLTQIKMTHVRRFSEVSGIILDPKFLMSTDIKDLQFAPVYLPPGDPAVAKLQAYRLEDTSGRLLSSCTLYGIPWKSPESHFNPKAKEISCSPGVRVLSDDGQITERKPCEGFTRESLAKQFHQVIVITYGTVLCDGNPEKMAVSAFYLSESKKGGVSTIRLPAVLHQNTEVLDLGRFNEEPRRNRRKNRKEKHRQQDFDHQAENFSDGGYPEPESSLGTVENMLPVDEIEDSHFGEPDQFNEENNTSE